MNRMATAANKRPDVTLKRAFLAETSTERLGLILQPTSSAAKYSNPELNCKETFCDCYRVPVFTSKFAQL